ncbi:MAG: hypothetical protein ACRD1X_12865, partial [Vicinamibacteria bacterium]
YSGEFEPSLPGRYAAVADITGTTSSGLSFSRQAAAEFTVVPVRSLLTGGFSDMGVDDDGNGLFDRIAIDVDADTLETGHYRLFVRLDTIGGRSLMRSTDAVLPAGPSVLTVDFEADAIQQLKEDGPYQLESLELLFMGPLGATSADRLRSAGLTRPYRLIEFEGFVETRMACDIDADGDIDINDITSIVAARGQPAGPGDPRDADGDGTITVLDARSCVLQCSHPRCVP